MTTVDNSYLVGLFNGSASSNNLFTALIPPTSSSTPAVSTSISNAARVPTPPWNSNSTAAKQATLTTQALAGNPFVNTSSINLDVSSASDDYRKLFAVYQGLNALDGIITKAQATGLTTLQQSQLQKAFAGGVSQISQYVNTTKFENLQLASGQTATAETTSSGVPVLGDTYTGQNMFVGDPNSLVPAFQGAVQFSLSAKTLGAGTTNVSFDLSEMGSTPRTLANVINYMNGKMAAAGLKTRFADKQTGTTTNTITVGGKTVTLPDAPATYALVLNTSALETVSLTAPAAADAVYVTQSATTTDTSVAKTPVMGTNTTTVGNVTTTTTGSNTTTTTVTQQLLKFQTDDSTTVDAPPDATPRPGDANSVAGRAWSETLASATTSALATATASDGSVYVLSNVDGQVAGQSIAGASDVALMKYDSAGRLIYTRTLGAQVSAQGLSLAVSADGKVAVAGSVTGALDNGDAGLDASSSDSFVSVYNQNGEEQWTQRMGATAADQANAVAFDANDNVFVAGKTGGPMPGAGVSYGGADGYLMGFSSTGTHEFTRQFGTASSDTANAITVNGSQVVVAGVDNGDAVVRSFDVSTLNAPTLTGTQDLGNLQGGNIAGVGIGSNGQIIVAGTARNPNLGSSVATAVNTAPGGANVFVASLDPSLTSNSANTIAWYGGSGDDTATAMTVAGGKVYVAGKTSTDLPGTTPIAGQDGFAAAIDPTTGNATWTERFSATGGNVTPQAIAVASGGASVLDRLGLPSGTLQLGDPSSLITSATALRAGDSFTVAGNNGAASKVTIAANDTLQTLATKIARASGFNAAVTVMSSGGVEQLKITPATLTSSVTLGPGAAGQDALDALGLKAGVIEHTPAAGSTATPLSGLDLSGALDLKNTADIATAKTVIEQAMSTIRVAYQTLATKGQPKPPATNNTSGTVPTYLSNQISNYTAALQRLTGGS